MALGGRIGTFVAGKWRLDRRLGSGRHTIVYSATHRCKGHRVAIKVLHPDVSRTPELHRRFVEASYAGNGVHHCGIARVHDDGVTDDGCAFLVMELIDGETLEAHCAARGGLLPADRAIEIALDLLDVLACAHARDVVHGDIRPANVFLTRRGRVKVADFGARFVEEADLRADIFGVGATLFTMLTGEPVDGVEDVAGHGVALLAAGVPEEVARVVSRALSSDPAARWSDANAMACALESVLDACRDEPPYSLASGM